MNSYNDSHFRWHILELMIAAVSDTVSTEGSLPLPLKLYIMDVGSGTVNSQLCKKAPSQSIKRCAEVITTSGITCDIVRLTLAG